MDQTYNYIIIGGGSAGCVLANRLSQDSKNQVLLIEAGSKDKDINIKIPASFSKLFKSEYDWGFETVKQPRLNNRKIYLPRGKVIGGSSSINAMIYIRGSRGDFDDWAKDGNVGWSYDEVLTYFKKSEHNKEKSDAYHGKEGPLNVEYSNYTNHLSQVFLKAGQELGIPMNEDFNGRSQEGFGRYQVTQYSGQRCSSAHAFLKPIESRSNLRVLYDAQVEKINIVQNVALGVTYNLKGKSLHAQAKNEVLVCAGSYQSPQLLLLSGIGDGDHLRDFNIPIIKHLPGVGDNLQDHLMLGCIFDSVYGKTLDAAERFPRMFVNLIKYLSKKEGPFSSNIAEVGGFTKSNPELAHCDIQWHFAPCFFINNGFDNPPLRNGFSIGTKVIAPSSKGHIKLKSKDWKEKPEIDHNYLETEDDIIRSIEAYKKAQDLGLTEAFKPYRRGFFKPERKLKSQDDIYYHIQEIAQTLYHPSSTCKMGIDNMSVVDPRLRVYGIDRLRVVDASIMPNVVRGNTNAATIMIAEKGADMILEDHK